MLPREVGIAREDHAFGAMFIRPYSGRGFAPIGRIDHQCANRVCAIVEADRVLRRHRPLSARTRNTESEKGGNVCVNEAAASSSVDDCGTTLCGRSSVLSSVSFSDVSTVTLPLAATERAPSILRVT